MGDVFYVQLRPRVESTWDCCKESNAQASIDAVGPNNARDDNQFQLPLLLGAG